MFEQVQAGWIGEAAAPLFDGVERIAEALHLRARSGLEIERKYLLHALPSPMPEATIQEIEQGYLPGERLIERVRRVRVGDAERYYRTVKLGAGLVRTGVEEECSRALFDVLWPLTEGKRAANRRREVADGALARRVARCRAVSSESKERLLLGRYHVSTHTIPLTYAAGRRGTFRAGRWQVNSISPARRWCRLPNKYRPKSPLCGGERGV